MDRDPCVTARRHQHEAGIAMITTLLILSLLLALAVAMTTSIVSDIQLRAAYDRATAGFYAAESGLDRGMGGYRDLFLSFKIPGTSDLQAQTVTVGNRTVTYSLADRNPTPGTPTTVYIPFGQVFGGLSAQQYLYTVNSSSVNTLGDTEATVGAEFQVGYIPLFQFVAFYNKDLEIDPGADMTLLGRVHTNGNLYLGPDTNATLTVTTGGAVTTVQVTAGGTINRGRKDDNTCNSSGSVQVLNASTPNALQSLNCLSSSTQQVPETTLANWGGNMQDHVTHISVPQPSITANPVTSSTCATSSCDYWKDANLRIALILNRNWAADSINKWPTGTSYPHSIVVLDNQGNIDTTGTTNLEKFIFQSPATSSPSFTHKFINNVTTTSTRPIFYTDAPNPGACTNCSNTNPGACTPTGMATCYSPNFQAAYESDGSNPLTADQRVYASVMTFPGRPAPTPTPRAADTDPRRGGFYNWREGRWTYLLNVNVHDLLQWNIDQSGPFFSPSVSTNGGIILYLTVYDNNNKTANLSNGYGMGVRVFGSDTLPFPSLTDLTGITVVSDKAMYVQGDYNSPGSGPWDMTNHPTSGWQPSSIVGDVLNILSNNYLKPEATPGIITNDWQSNRSLDDASRNATTTTVNTGFIANVDTTTPGGGRCGYNGGLENYPRFHEDWGSVTLNYNGSFISLGTSSTVTGPWCCAGASSGTGGTYSMSTNTVESGYCNVYNPPQRNWNFDPNFQNAAYLPPLTPRFVYVQQIRFTENFQ